MIARFIQTIDILLLTRIFMPIAHWVDYRFHKNQWTLAGWVMNAALAMNVANSADMVLRDGWVGAIAIPASAAIVFMYFDYVKRFKSASEAYERRPDQITRDQAWFIGGWFYGRFMLLSMGLGIFMLEVVAHSALHQARIIYLVTQPWLVAAGMALYFAGGLPPHRDRKKKKERYPWTALFPKLATIPK